MKIDDVDNLRIDFDKIIKDKNTTVDQLVYLFVFLKGFTFVVDNEIKKRYIEKAKKWQNEK